MATKKRVLITGAGGRIGTSLTQAYLGRYDLRLHFYPTIPDQPATSDYVEGNLSDFAVAKRALDGMDAVIHLAGNPSTQASWESVRENNIEATYNVYEAARQAGANKLVLATTNHVMGMYDRDGQWPVYANQPVRPDSLYGVSKAFGETLARHYVDRYGMSAICLRIGWFLPAPRDEISRWMWLSPRDAAQIFSLAVESSLPYGVFYAISNNSGRHWDITDAIEKLGYRPQDDADREMAGGGDKERG